MLKNIKSSYFFNQLIFIHIEERQKLKLINYNNKSLQKNMNISIFNYKHFSGRYIIYKSNGIGKECDDETNRLKFEGEYSNEERNGKGKEYFDYGELEFEGEYLKGQKDWNGKGKECGIDGELEYEGEYLNGQKNGKEKNIFGMVN